MISNASPQTATQISKLKKRVLLSLGFLELLIFSFACYLFIPIVLSSIALQSNLRQNGISFILELGLLISSLLVALAQIVIGVFSLEKKIGVKKINWLINIGILLQLLLIPAFILLVLDPIREMLLAI